MVRIDFLIPGFSKCGTTTLCALVAQHPQLYIPAIKEPWYFSSDKFEEQEAQYAQHFTPALDGQLLGEGSVSYSEHTKEDISIQRIMAHNPDCRFIFIARNPLDRIESSYREMHHSGVQFGLNAPYPLGENLAVFPQMIRDSCFFQRISKYVKAFGQESILVLFLEDLKARPQAELARCFRHLGVDESFRADTELRLNAGSSKYYDTHLLRYLRNHPFFGPRLARIDPPTQAKLLQPVRMRRKFNRPVVWDQASSAAVAEIVVPDAHRFLEVYGKAPDFWRFDMELRSRR